MRSKNLWKGMRGLPEEAKKGITVKVDAALHAEVRQYIEEHNMTMAEFVAAALASELHPKTQEEEKEMGPMRTLAFQVPEELFWKIKDYLKRNHMTQKDFVLGLIERELERDLAAHESLEGAAGAAGDAAEGAGKPGQEAGQGPEPMEPGGDLLEAELEAVSRELEALAGQGAPEGAFGEPEPVEEGGIDVEDGEGSGAEGEDEDESEAEGEDEDEEEGMGFSMGM